MESNMLVTVLRYASQFHKGSNFIFSHSYSNISYWDSLRNLQGCKCTKNVRNHITYCARLHYCLMYSCTFLSPFITPKPNRCLCLYPCHQAKPKNHSPTIYCRSIKAGHDNAIESWLKAHVFPFKLRVVFLKSLVETLISWSNHLCFSYKTHFMAANR